MFSLGSWRSFDSQALRWFWMELGPASLPLIAVASVFVSLTLTTGVILELKQHGAQDVTGAVIAVGLLRELAGLTVGAAWTSRATALIRGTVLTLSDDVSTGSANKLVPPIFVAAIASAFALSAFGLAIGLLTSAYYAPLLGVSSSADFLEAARQMVNNKDLCVYLIKLILMNPTIAVIVGCGISIERHIGFAHSVTSAVTLAAMLSFIANFAVTAVAYLS